VRAGICPAPERSSISGAGGPGAVEQRAARIVADLARRILDLDGRISDLDEEITEVFRGDERATAIESLPGPCSASPGAGSTCCGK